MNFPLSSEAAVWAAIPLGMLFGVLLHRGGVADYDVIVNQFRLRDFTVLKIMFTAIVVGGLGVWSLHAFGFAQYHIKPANLLGVILGAALFGVGMVLYGYCPGTGVAAMATGSLHAATGFAGMLAGSVLYALTYPWVETHIQKTWAFGKLRLPDWSGLPEVVWWTLLMLVAAGVFGWLEVKWEPAQRSQLRKTGKN
jgi:hypothetical protein